MLLTWTGRNVNIRAAFKYMPLFPQNHIPSSISHRLLNSGAVHGVHNQPNTILTKRFGRVFTFLRVTLEEPCLPPRALLSAQMRNPPPDVVASWPTPNYTNPETRGPALIIVELLAVSISTICLGLRLYVRACIVRSVGWDDWLMVSATVRMSSSYGYLGLDRDS
jgi:hypothetical protein